MYQGFVLSESLKDPTILNNFDKVYVKVENHPECKGCPKIWHDFKLKVDDKDIKHITNLLSEQMEDTWYAHFWNDKDVYVVLPNKVFKSYMWQYQIPQYFMTAKKYIQKQKEEKETIQY